ncbi:MAG: hypothetical protein J6V07_03580 [Clostridia bacterium]|nr:hypothetical protein [Clostridia bacterium]
MNHTHLLIAQKNGATEALYADRVNSLLRARYSLSEELSLLRRRDECPEAFAAYSAFAEECKRAARAEIPGGDA